MNPNRTCGGGSGGDAGLVFSKCVPFSIGCDIDGAGLHLPAAFTGVYSFKPTSTRLSNKGIGASKLNRYDDFKIINT